MIFILHHRGHRVSPRRSESQKSGLTSPFNLPAPGRRQPLYVVFDFAETCVFVKQSPYAFHCDPLGLLALAGRPFARSYGSNLPSSLTSLRSSAFGYSPRLTVSV